MRPRVRMLRRVVGLLLLCLGTLVFVGGGLTCWEPGGAWGHGLEALVRFAKDFGEFFYVALGFWTAGWFLLRRQL